MVSIWFPNGDNISAVSRHLHITLRLLFGTTVDGSSLNLCSSDSGGRKYLHWKGDTVSAVSPDGRGKGIIEKFTGFATITGASTEFKNPNDKI